MCVQNNLTRLDREHQNGSDPCAITHTHKCAQVSKLESAHVFIYTQDVDTANTSSRLHQSIACTPKQSISWSELRMVFKLRYILVSNA